MSSRLNPRDYDLGELRDAVRETPRGDEDDTGGARDDGRPGDLSAIRDLLHGDAGDGTEAGGTADGRQPAAGTSDTRSIPDGTTDARSTAEGTTDARSDGHTSGRQVPGDGAAEADDTDGIDGTDRSEGTDGTGDTGDTDDPPADDSDGRTGRAPGARMRRPPARSARPGRRERTRDGEPERRPERVDAVRSQQGSSTGTGRPSRVRTPSGERGAGVGGFELLAAGGGDPGRPYLDRLPDAYRAQLEIFEWLEWLLGTCGREATAAALTYYEEVGWLSEGAREDLEGFLEGLAAAEPRDPRPLGVDDHRESLRYVARLARRAEG